MKQVNYITIVALLVTSMTVSAQEYAYDAHGNLATDGNKQIASIHYNHLNLVDTITYTDGRHIIYTYLSSGQKLGEQAIDAQGKIVTNKTYIDQFLYNNDTLREIHHDDGRAVPTLPGNAITTWEYQYHLKDHLGNVRTILTSAPGTQTTAASFETPTAGGFLRYEDARRINAVLFDHTRTGSTHYAQRLNGSANEKYGLAKSLSVMPGDTVQLQVFAKYVDPNAGNLTAALTTLVAQIATGTAPAGTVVDGAGYSTNSATPFPFAGLNNTSSSTGTGPEAYLNWLFFKRDFTFKSGGFVRMTTAAKENGTNVAHEKLTSTLVINEPGYVYVYLSNEEASFEVYFDDLSVTHIPGPVIQQTEYDPFGLAFNEFSRENAAPNNFLYNGKELQSDFDLNWYDYGARMYDAALGRWHVIDPLAEKYASVTPYNYALNNPVNLIDPRGMEPKSNDNSREQVTYITNDIIKNPDKIRDPLLRDAFQILLTAKEGRAIMERALKEKVSIYITLLSDIDEIQKPDGSVIAGHTFMPGQDDNIQIKIDPKTKQRTIVTKDDKLIRMFNGIKVKQGNDARLIILTRQGDNLLSKYYVASAIAHEVACHTSPTMLKELLDFGFNLGKTSNMQHQLFGSSSANNFNLLKDGTPIFQDITDNSPASRLAKELAAAASKEALTP